MEMKTDKEIEYIKNLSEQFVDVFNEIYNKIKPIVLEAFRVIKNNLKAYNNIVNQAMKASGKSKYLKRCRNRDKLYQKRRRMGR